MSKLLWLIVLVIVVAVGFGLVKIMKQKPEQKPVEQTVQTPNPKFEIIGKSVEGRSIEAYTYVNPASLGASNATNATAQKRLLLVGGIHGGYEWNSVLLAYQVMDHLKANLATIPAGLSVTIIPSLNPDGVFKVIGKEGRFTLADAPTTTDTTGLGRFNAHGVDLNRNFACNWQPKATWRSREVGAGTAAFSEPEAAAFRDFVTKNRPSAAVFWHSQANAVYASECEQGILPATLEVMNSYATAAGYPAIKSFDAYVVNGDAEAWLASIGVPAITVEMKTHLDVEFEKNLAGVKALFTYFGK